MKSTTVFIFLTMLLIVGCKDSSTNNPDPTVSDSVFTDIRDGKKYSIVKINKQVWMSENLDASTYRNGDSIRHASTLEEWLDASEKQVGAWCYYNHDPINGEIYGKQYNLYAVNDTRGLAPAGYHIPSDKEWTVLTDFLGGEDLAGQKMKSLTGWADSGNGTNSSGFNGLPGGYCFDTGDFDGVAEVGGWWSSSEYDSYSSWGRFLNTINTKVFRGFNDKGSALSVRCLRD